ncbi:MAG: type II toxin-antitoxin system HicB family antitoxin [Methylacidiphilales bacterium]|nr:type II toxin-antitoxin system HicB family antitoxin [Candidatus Methylacidiphilales bacterium]
MLKYKGYAGQVSFDAEAKIFHGEVLGLKDVITFQGTTVKELERAFRDSIEDYLEFCAKRGEKPEKPCSGKFVVRLSPALHSRVIIEARQEGVSLNRFVEESLEQRLVHT